MKHYNRGGLFLSLVAILGLILAACGDMTVPTSQNTTGNSSATTKTQPPVKVGIGYAAPDFTAKTVEGETIQLSQLRGKAVIINFWATY